MVIAAVFEPGPGVIPISRPQQSIRLGREGPGQGKARGRPAGGAAPKTAHQLSESATEKRTIRRDGLLRPRWRGRATAPTTCCRRRQSLSRAVTSRIAARTTTSSGSARRRGTRAPMSRLRRLV